MKRRYHVMGALCLLCAFVGFAMATPAPPERVRCGDGDGKVNAQCQIDSCCFLPPDEVFVKMLIPGGYYVCEAVEVDSKCNPDIAMAECTGSLYRIVAGDTCEQPGLTIGLSSCKFNQCSS